MLAARDSIRMKTMKATSLKRQELNIA